MFGHRFFGRRFFGQHYWGQAAGGSSGTHISARFGGVWKAATPSIRRSGTWVHPVAVFAYHTGAWQQVYPI